MAIPYTRYWQGIAWTPLGDTSGKSISIPDVGIEVLYPIQPKVNSNIIPFQQDSREWSQVQKSSSAWRNEITTLKYRIKMENFRTFYSYLVDNKHRPVVLTLPGVQPFIRAAQTNSVYIIDIGQPVLILARHYEMSVTYLNVLKTATT